jgi:hypothetical protein
LPAANRAWTDRQILWHGDAAEQRGVCLELSSTEIAIVHADHGHGRRISPWQDQSPTPNDADHVD